MKQPIQKRTLETRRRLISAAEELINAQGYYALRVEDVVKAAGVAKGTFFSHFRDKDALMEFLIGGEIDRHLDAIEALPTPKNVQEIVASLSPMMQFMTSERYVFDVILRYSGAALSEDIGAIALTMDRHAKVVGGWLTGGPFRRDVSVQMLAEGVQAFAVQTMALHFCELHNDVSQSDRLAGYLKAWLQHGSAL